MSRLLLLVTVFLLGSVAPLLFPVPGEVETMQSSTSMFTVSRPRKGKPFEAEYETTRSTTAGWRETKRGKLYVDSAARIRNEFSLDDMRVVSIWDPDTKMGVLLDAASGTVLVPPSQDELPEDTGSTSAAQPTAPPGSNEPSREPAEFIGEDLGARVIEGFDCVGHRTKTKASGHFAVDTWVATELGLVLLEKRVTEDEEVEYRIFNIRRGEPDASLFRIPPN